MAQSTWWVVWGDLTKKLGALVASFASMAGLLVSLAPAHTDWPWWAVTLLIISIVFFALLVVLEFFDRRGRHIYAKTDHAGIREYMHDWIKDAGRVAIWTRDMSWANNSDTRSVLQDKAAKNELVICLPKLNEHAKQLKRDGAEVCIYGADLLESPASRFTITHLGTGGSRIAVGRAEGDAHIIEEFKVGSHPAFHLAADLVALARALHRRQS
jgi:hypothetical protein